MINARSAASDSRMGRVRAQVASVVYSVHRVYKPCAVVLTRTANVRVARWAPTRLYYCNKTEV